MQFLIIFFEFLNDLIIFNINNQLVSSHSEYFNAFQVYFLSKKRIKNFHLNKLYINF